MSKYSQISDFSVLYILYEKRKWKLKHVLANIQQHIASSKVFLSFHKHLVFNQMIKTTTTTTLAVMWEP